MERSSYNNPSLQMSQESSQVVKLPLAPIGGSNATVSTRRGSSIFSPTVILDNNHLHQQQSTPPLVQLNQLACLQTETTPDPDPDPSQNSQETSTSNNIVKHRECLKNHAAGMGAHVLDGCGEFMPGGPEGTPEFLKCAACDCHRNFHRKEGEGNNNSSNVYQSPMPHNRHSQTQQQQLQLLGKNSHSFSHGPAPPAMMNFGGGGAVESSSEDLNVFGSGSGGHAVMGPSYSGSRKRFRTKFSQDQRDKMHDFAEKMEWRMQKQNEHEVQQFCAEVGVKRQVFKVWMHNNKQAMKKRQVDF